MAPIKTSVIGAGMALGLLHWPSIACQRDQFTLHSVMDRSGRGKVKELCGEDVKVVNSLQGVVEDAEVELVVVASPNTTHYEYVTAALNAGKHVLVEKPITPTAEQALELAQLARSKGLILAVYQNRRWDSDFLTVQKLIQEGTLGDMVDFQSSYDRYRPLLPDAPPLDSTWKTTPGQGNDVIYNLGSHIIDQAYVLFGMPEKLSCRCWDVRDIGLDEAFHLELYYPSPSPSKPTFTVTLRATILSAHPKQFRFVAKGTKGSYVKYGVDPQGDHVVKLSKTGIKDDAYGREQEEEWGELYLAKEEKEGTEWETTRLESEKGDWPYLYTNLAAAIKAKDPNVLITKPEQAADVIRLIELGMQSSREGRVLDVKA